VRPPLGLAELKVVAASRLAAYEFAASLPNAPTSLFRAIRELDALIREMDVERPIVVVAGLIPPGERRDLGEMRREIAANFQARFDAIRV
jgi:methylmalonyl-CoA mutase cobalamin-binding subunit